MIEAIRGSSKIIQGLFVMGVGILGVFFVLVLFYLSIKVIGKIFPSDKAAD